MKVNRGWMSVASAVTALFFVSPAFGESVNKSIEIGAGETSNGAETVNGSIKVGAGATVDGAVETVNGRIRIGDNAVLGGAETVNGSIDVGNGVHAVDLTSVNGSVNVGSDGTIDGELSVVNGGISVHSGTTVKRDVSNVNGEIQISGAEIGGDIETVAGDVVLENGAVLHGDINVKKPNNWSQNWTHNKPTVVIGPGCRVDGTIKVEHEVKLYISNTATVGSVSGVMSMDDAVRFDGARP